MPIPREATVTSSSSTGLRRHQPQMQEHIDLFLVHDTIDYTRVSKIFWSTAVTVKLCHSTVNNRSNRQTLSLNGQQPQ